jgi:hypothetical protein
MRQDVEKAVGTYGRRLKAEGKEIFPKLSLKLFDYYYL